MVSPSSKKDKKLTQKFRLIILNSQTLEELFSLKLSPLNVITTVGLIILVSMTIAFLLIFYSPLKQYVPGYPTIDYKKELLKLSFRIDSLQENLSLKEFYLKNLQHILKGEYDSMEYAKVEKIDSFVRDPLLMSELNPNDTAFRNYVEYQERFNILFTPASAAENSIKFFPPVKGYVNNVYNEKELHYGVDIPTHENELVKAASDGKVIVSEWTIDNGYLLAIQHKNNWISIYMHNGALLKKKGDRVRAGEPIAFAGNTGENSTGPHLHFELWYNGNPVDPQKYIIFD